MSDPTAREARPQPDGSAAYTTRSSRRRAEHDTRRRGWLTFLRDVVVIVVAAVIISALIQNFLIRSFYIPSASMENTLQINDRIIVNRLQPSLSPIEHGDIVVFRDPGGWLDPNLIPAPEQNGLLSVIDQVLGFVGLTAPDSGEHLVKRVIGLPGDEVACCNTLGQLTVNGVPIDESPYVLLPAGETRASGIDFDVVVPPDSLWVMGDNRYDSADSRLNQDTPSKGFVPFSSVVGRAVVISWPIDRWTWLDDYPSVFAGVESGEP
ncbi:MAG: signal peptidase I [Actinomycetales bacterium]|nr:signal peptidase I [Actinomycetales bacterium]